LIFVYSLVFGVLLVFFHVFARLYLGDHHAGLVYNTLWAQSMTRLLHDRLGLAVTPIRDDEVVRFVEALTKRTAVPAR